MSLIKFVGLQILVRMCEESNIRAIERLNRGDVVVRGSFEDVENLQLIISKVMSERQSSTAFKVAFATTFSSLLQPTTSADGVVVPGRELSGSVGRWGGSAPTTPPDWPETATGPLEDSKHVNAEGNLEVSRHLWKFQFEQKQTTWRIAYLVAAERIENIEKKFEVKIGSKAVDRKVAITIDGQSLQIVDNARSSLSKNVEELEPQIAEEVIPLGECTDVKWLQKINWKGHKVFYSLAEGNSCWTTA